MDSLTVPSISLVRKREDTELMPPPPPAKRIKRPKQVLDEDTYTDALSRIIARDFFPGLLESQTQQEYLDAVESKDEEWIASASRRLEHVMTPRRERRAHGEVAAEARQGEDRTEIDTSMSLGSFQSKYTSEDNESFYKLLDKQNQKRAEKYAWLWTGNKLPSKQQLKQREVEERLRLTRGSLADDGFKKDRLAIQDKDDRPAAPDHWKSKPNNELMFVPDGVDDMLETVANRAQAESRAPPKMIIYENTRMPQVDVLKEDDVSVPGSPSLSAVRDAIAGRRRPSDRESTVNGGETPRVNGYAFVDDEEPEQTPALRPAPKIKLESGDGTSNPFQLQEQRKREALHHRLVDRIAESKRSSAKLGFTGKVEKTPVPKFPSSPRVSGSFTPAAQRLWGKIDSAGRRITESPFSNMRATPRATPGPTRSRAGSVARSIKVEPK